MDYFESELGRVSALTIAGDYKEALGILRTLRASHLSPQQECRLLEMLVGIHCRLSETAESITLAKKWITLVEKLNGQGEDHSRALAALAGAYIQSGNVNKARQNIAKAISLSKKLKKVGTEPYGLMTITLGRVCYLEEKYGESAKHFRQAIQILEKFERTSGLEIAHRWLAYSYEKQGKNEEAEKLHCAARTLSLARVGNQHPDYANTVLALGEHYLEREMCAEARPHLQEACRIIMAVFGGGHAFTIDALEMIEKLELLSKPQADLPEIPYFDSICIELKAEEKFGGTNERARKALTDLSTAVDRFLEDRDYEGAMQTAANFSDEVCRQCGPHSKQCALACGKLAACHMAMGASEKAVTLLRLALRILPKCPVILFMLGIIEQMACRYEEAIVFYEVGEQNVRTPLLYALLWGLSTCYQGTNQWDWSYAKCVEHITLTEKAYGKESSPYADSLFFISYVYAKLKQYELAIESLDRALEIRKRKEANDAKKIDQMETLRAAYLAGAASAHRESIDVCHGFRMCGACGNVRDGIDACTGCYCAWYCNAECQLRDWPAHKPRCMVCFTCDTPLDRDAESLRCSSCQDTKYCSEKCLQMDRVEHEKTCK